MDFFAILQPVIESNVEQLCSRLDLTREALFAQVRERLTQLHRSYRNRGETDIPYSDPVCRLAYLFCYVPMGAALCEDAIRAQPALAKHLAHVAAANGVIRVCAFGGGPGTEQIALCNWLDAEATADGPVRVCCTVLDRVAEWADSLVSIDKGLANSFSAFYGRNCRDWPAIPQTSFYNLDIMDTEKFAGLPELFSDEDVYILNYVVSELHGQEAALREAIEYIATEASPEAHFLVIDRAESKIRRFVDECADELELVEVDRAQWPDYRMSTDHQKSSLGALLDEVGELPRLKSNTFARTFRAAEDR